MFLGVEADYSGPVYNFLSRPTDRLIKGRWDVTAEYYGRLLLVMNGPTLTPTPTLSFSVINLSMESSVSDLTLGINNLGYWKFHCLYEHLSWLCGINAHLQLSISLIVAGSILLLLFFFKKTFLFLVVGGRQWLFFLPSQPVRSLLI